MYLDLAFICINFFIFFIILTSLSISVILKQFSKTFFLLLDLLIDKHFLKNMVKVVLLEQWLLFHLFFLFLILLILFLLFLALLVILFHLFFLFLVFLLPFHVFLFLDFLFLLGFIFFLV